MQSSTPSRRLLSSLLIGFFVLFVALLLGVILFGWLKEFVIFGTFDYVLATLVDTTGASTYLIKGILVLVLVPFFLAMREIGKLPLFRAKGVVIPKQLAWG